ncbi:transposase [Micromonospora sp. DT44]|uniref:transposase n=1 Tax=Micromonospora sp. DT44 TaxID=3393439 RepID=UPI003CEA7605
MGRRSPRCGSALRRADSRQRARCRPRRCDSNSRRRRLPDQPGPQGGDSRSSARGSDRPVGRRGSKAIREHLRQRGIGHTIPERADQQANRHRRGSRGGRPPVFDKQLYKRRNVVERCFNRLKQCRSVATHYDKTATLFQATVTIAALN